MGSLVKAVVLHAFSVAFLIQSGGAQDPAQAQVGLGLPPCSTASGYKVITKTFRNATHTLRVNKTEPLKIPGTNTPCPDLTAGGAANGGVNANASAQAQVSSNKDCSDQVSTCPQVAGTPLEIGTNKDGAFVITGNAGPDIQWRYAQKEEMQACLKETTAGGKDSGNIPQYICRTNFNSNWVPGKISLENNNCDFTCDVNMGFHPVKVPIANDKTTQILMYQESALSWVKAAEDGNYEGSLVNVGQSGEIILICRSVDASGNSYIGRFMADSKQCSVMKGDKGSTETTNIEVLIFMPVSKGCSAQTEDCPPLSGDPVEVGTAKNGAFSVTGQAGADMNWRTVTNEDVKACLKETKPSGTENEIPLYICRTNYNSFWVPGKIAFDEKQCEFTCDIGGGYAAIKIPIENDENTQILMDPKLAVSWVKPGKEGKLPPNLIKGGQNLNGVIAPLCRYADGKGNTYIGKFLGDYKNCWYLKGDIETRASDGVDILASTEIDKSKNCPEQSNTCTADDGEPVDIASSNDGATEISGVAEPQVKWKDVQKEEIAACLKETTAAGTEPGPLFQYVCRAFYNYEWIPGKLALEDSTCNAGCDILLGNEAKRIPFDEENKIQILSYAQDAINWAKVPEGETDFQNLIVGGPIKSRDPIPICRFSDGGGNNYVGHYAVSHSTCWYQSGTKISVGSGDKVEVLIQGKTLSSGKSKSNCVDQSATCPVAIGNPVEMGAMVKGAFTKTGFASNDIQWRSVQKMNVAACLKETTQGGQEGQHPQYVCRALYKSLWVPGKLLFDENACEFTCDIGASFKAIKTPIDNTQEKNTQILMYPKSALNWGKLASYPSLPSGLINGGQNINGELAPLCRVVNDNGDSFIGKYLPAYRSCWYAHGEKEESETKASNIEILMSASAAKYCPEQKDTCSSGAGADVEIGVYKDGAAKPGPKATGDVKWKDVKEDEITACFKAATESGTEPGPVPQYLCRAFHKSNWVPGKLVVKSSNPCEAACEFPLGYEVIRVEFGNGNKIQMLSFTPGSISWNTMNPSTTSIENFIIGGKTETVDMIPLCRFNDGKNNKYIGQFALGYSTCWYLEPNGQNGSKVSIGSNKNNIELLLSGQASASGLGKACPAPVASCPQGTGFPVEVGSKSKGVTGTVPGIQWRYIQREDIKACIKETAPSGKDKEKRSTYLCRTFYNAYWVPGILVVDKNSCDYTCDINGEDKVLKIPIGEKNTQLLMYKPEVLEWTKPSKTDKAEASAEESTMLIGGHSVKGEIVGLCRFKDGEGNVYLGIFNGQACSYSDDEEGIWEEEETEVIITVFHGGQKNNCQSQKSTCEPGTRIPGEIGLNKNGIFTITGAAKDLEWRFVNKDEVSACLKETTPAGMSKNIPQYICRTFQKGLWTPGRLSFDKSNCDFTCDVGAGGKATKYPIGNDQTTQILMFQPQNLRSVPLANAGAEQSNLFNAGTNIANFKPTPLCRYVEAKGTMFLGKYNPDTRRCWYTIDETEYSVTTNIEIFLTNNAEPPPNCPAQACTDDERFDVEVASLRNGKLEITGLAGPELKWKTVTKENIKSCMEQTTVAGQEPDKTQAYFCRATHSGAWKIGRVKQNKKTCDFTCHILIRSGWTVEVPIQSGSKDVQLLMYSSSAVNWQVLDNPNAMLDNILVGGKSITIEDTLLCRYAWEAQGGNMLGSFLPSTKWCRFAYMGGSEGGNVKIQFIVAKNVRLKAPVNNCQAPKATACTGGVFWAGVGAIVNGKFRRTGDSGLEVKFQEVTPDTIKACLATTDIVGQDPDQTSTYFCRAFHSNEWRPGKLKYDKANCRYACHFYLRGAPIQMALERTGMMVHLLVYTSFDVNFVDSAGTTIHNLCIAGMNDGSEDTLFCRYRTAQGFTLIGNYLPSTRFCYAHPDGNERSNVNIQLFVVKKPHLTLIKQEPVQQVQNQNQCVPENTCANPGANEKWDVTLWQLVRGEIIQIGNAKDGVHWRTVNKRNVKACMRTTWYGGIENNRQQVMCRTYHNNKWIPGKMYWDDAKGCNFDCEIGVDQFNIKKPVADGAETQLLVNSAGRVGWVSLKLIALPYKFILGGQNMQGLPAPICRWVEGNGNYHVGKLYPSLRDCFYTIGDKEFYATANVELLVYDPPREIPDVHCAGHQNTCVNPKGPAIDVGRRNPRRFFENTGWALEVFWKDVTREDVKACLKATTAMGMENGSPQYLCRSWQKTYWLPGKLTFNKNSCSFTCDAGAAHRAYKYTVGGNVKVQILFHNQDLLMWQKMDMNNLPQYVINAGNAHHGGDAPICRHKDNNGNAFLGKVDTNWRTCWYPVGDVEHYVDHNIEILGLKGTHVFKAKG